MFYNLYFVHKLYGKLKAFLSVLQKAPQSSRKILYLEDFRGECFAGFRFEILHFQTRTHPKFQTPLITPTFSSDLQKIQIRKLVEKQFRCWNITVQCNTVLYLLTSISNQTWHAFKSLITNCMTCAGLKISAAAFIVCTQSMMCKHFSCKEYCSRFITLSCFYKQEVFMLVAYGIKSKTIVC